MHARALTLATALSTLAFAPLAAADSCAGFVDVPSAASYCTAAEWMKTRGITLGCSDAAHFCPDNTVTRAQMALFMQRLGDAATPTLIRDVEFLAGADLPDGMLFTDCTLFVGAATYPRVARLSGTYYGSAATTGARVKFFYSADNSGLLDVGNFSLPVVTGDASPVTYSTQLALDVGVPYAFVFGPANDSGDTLAISEAQCSLDAVVVNAVATPVLADVAPPSAPAARVTPLALPLPR